MCVCVSLDGINIILNAFCHHKSFFFNNHAVARVCQKPIIGLFNRLAKSSCFPYLLRSTSAARLSFLTPITRVGKALRPDYRPIDHRQ